MFSLAAVFAGMSHAQTIKLEPLEVTSTADTIHRVGDVVFEEIPGFAMKPGGFPGLILVAGFQFLGPWIPDAAEFPGVEER